MTVPERIRSTFYSEAPWTFDHEDVDLAAPMVAPAKEGRFSSSFIVWLVIYVAIVLALVYGIARAIDMGEWSWVARSHPAEETGSPAVARSFHSPAAS